MSDSPTCDGAAPSSPLRMRLVGRRSSIWLGLVVGGALSGASFACDRGSDARAETATAEASQPSDASVTPATGVGEATGAASGKASYKEDGFELTLEAPGPFTPGKAAEARVVLVAKNGFKVNDQYPFKLTLNDAAGLELPSKVVTRDAMTLEKHQGVMKVAFTPKSPGQHTLSGRFSFSVCTDERCLIEKRELEVPVAVK